MKSFLIVGACALAAVSLSGCAGFSALTGNPVADVKTAAANVGAVNSSLSVLNDKLMTQIIQVCGLDVDLNVAIPNPVPTGSLKFGCHIAPGGLAVGSVTPLAQVTAQTLGAAAAPAAPVVPPK